MTLYEEVVKPYYNVPTGVKITEKRIQNLLNNAKIARGYIIMDDNTSDGFVYTGEESLPVFGQEYKSDKTGKKTFITICKMLVQQLGDVIKRFSKDAKEWAKMTYNKIIRRNPQFKSILLESPCFVGYVPFRQKLISELIDIIKLALPSSSSSKLWSNKTLRQQVKNLCNQDRSFYRAWPPEAISYDDFLSNALLAK